MDPSHALQVAIEARVQPGIQGGVEQVAVGLAHGLSRLKDSPETYHLVTAEDSRWIEPYLGPNCRVVRTVTPLTRPAWRDRLAKSMPLVADAWGNFKRTTIARNEPILDPVVPVSDGTVERLGVDVVHFTMQVAYLTDVPSIYHPHDLQHLHYPEFFSAEAIRWREKMYRTFCEQAKIVSVTTEWGKRDLMEHYGLPADKIAVVPLAPAVATYRPLTDSEASRLVSDVGVTEPYVFYPAQTWLHKNHLRLVEAVHRARSEAGVDLRLVCSGHLNTHYEEIQKKVRELGMEEIVRFVGFVNADTVRALYQRSRLMVFPSLFEAAGGFGPVFEAFDIGTPVATSSATSLAEQAGDAALIFDPTSIDEMAGAMVRLWDDEDLRAELTRRGHARVEQFTWERVARTFRALYRRAAGRALTDEEQRLVGAPSPY
jgi:glycosyltransferase involved in cell wall biosynthesis